MTPQETFDRVAKHLLTQNKRSYDFMKGLCKYRHKVDGKILKYAVGCLIEDDEYEALFEGSSISCDRSNPVVSLMIEKGYNLDLLQSLQRIHDIYEPFNWKKELCYTAQVYNLNITVLLSTTPA